MFGMNSEQLAAAGVRIGMGVTGTRKDIVWGLIAMLPDHLMTGLAVLPY
jgi:hypothetical protein